MKLFKKLDNYLLHYYPTIWITRIHSFIPIGLGIALLLFIINASIGWNPKDDMPNNEVPIILMIIPVLIYLVYWFVFQSRYNVAKSGGRMPLSFEYLNFLSYILVFLTALLIICAIPISNYQKVRNAIDEQSFRTDLEKLNEGNPLVFNSGGVTLNQNGSLSYYPAGFTYQAYDYAYDYELTPEYGSQGSITVTQKQAQQIIGNFIKAYNKYSRSEITRSSAEILADIMDGDGYMDDLFGGSYNAELEYDYNYDYAYDNSWEVQYKLSRIEEGFESGWYGEYSEPWFWKIAIGLIAFLSMIVWTFKQMKLRQFVFGFISLCLTPLLAGIVAIIIFEILRIRHDEEETIAAIALLVYLLLAIIVIRAFRSPTLHNTGYVMTMYLQFFLPLIPLFIWLYFLDDNYWGFYEESFLDFIYWSGWVVGLTSIAAFKPLYAKFRSLPSKN